VAPAPSSDGGPDMSSRALLGVLAALAVLVALAVAISISEHPPASAAGGTLLYPQLKAKLNDVGKLTVRTAGNHTVATIERGKSGWTVAERHGYSADLGKIRKVLLALAEAKLLEEKTSKADLYSKLGVADIEKEGGNGVRIDLAVGGESLGLIVGNMAAGEQTYVRRAGEQTSWLVSGAVSVPREVNDWLDRTIVNLQTSRVRRVTITQPEGTTLRVAKADPDATSFEVLDMPPGRQLAYSGATTAVASALADAAFDNVFPAAEFNAGDTKPVTARFETFDGLAVEARVYKSTAGTRVQFSAYADPSLATPSPQTTAAAAPPATDKATPAKVTAAVTASDAKAPEKPADAKAAAKPADGKPPAAPTKPATTMKSLAEVKAEADELNARFSKWVYVLPDFKVEQLTKKMDGMLQPLPAKPSPANKPVRTSPTPAKKPG
jgi:hypothetical protein